MGGAGVPGGRASGPIHRDEDEEDEVNDEGVDEDADIASKDEDDIVTVTILGLMPIRSRSDLTQSLAPPARSRG